MSNDKTADPSLLRDFAAREGMVLETAMRQDLAGTLQGCDPLLAEVIAYALFGGGKRIRPLLAILSARLCGSAGRDLYTLAAAFEYLHVATLVHDDVIDNAGERRGRDSVVHKYGEAAAILAGDWLHARSMHLVGRHAGPDGLEVFCSSTAGMVDGEFLQLRHVADFSIGEDDYFAVILRKTALLISSTCEIGAIYGGGSAVRREALARYGNRLGIAFQIIDDLLDYQGNTAATGKQTGNDLAEGKVTLPLIRTLARAGEEDRQELLRLAATALQGTNTMTEVIRLIETHGGFSSARKTAEQMVGEAVAALDIFAGDPEQESLVMLKALAGYVLARNR